jgi:cytochrome c oxidase subunit II
MLAIGLVAGVVTTLVAVLIQWLPTSASKEMDRITFVFWFTTVICIVVFSVVVAVIIYSVIAFRVKPDDDTDGPPIHGHSGLEVAWTAIPAILVIAIGVVTAVVLSRNADAGPNPLRVQVYAQQFAWKFVYPNDGGVKSKELVLPVDRGVKFELTSVDVIHSFWIPEMGQKMDALPGVTTEIVITPTRTGSFSLICTELCGVGHSTMRAPVRVLSKTDFASWLDDHRGAGGASTGGGAEAADGKALFAANGCGGCHTFTPAGANGAIGPSLDEVGKRAEAAGAKPEDYVHQAIVEPNAVLADGYQPNVMPGTFAKTLSPAEIDALVSYLLGGKA